MALALSSAVPAGAQTWTGGYLGGSIGTGIPRADAYAEETVLFDTNLDGTFSDTVRTAAGADAFSPGFCGGIAVGSLPSAGCVEDEDGIDIGGRAGYDWQMGGLVFGALVDISTTDVIDGVPAFSTTPAFYAFSRELNYVGGLRGRLGGGSDRVLVMAPAGRRGVASTTSSRRATASTRSCRQRTRSAARWRGATRRAAASRCGWARTGASAARTRSRA